MQITHCQSVDATQHAAVNALNELFTKSAGSPILFLTSGGSSLALVDKIQTHLLGSHMTVSVLDERFTNDYSQRNFEQLKTHSFYREAQEKGCQFINPQMHDDDTLEQAAEDFECQLRAWKEEHDNGIVIITQGVGANSHTSGIFPDTNPDAFAERFEGDAWTVGYEPGGEFPKRFTVTATFLQNHVDHAVTYIVGDEKQQAYDLLTAEDGHVYVTPSRILREMKDVQVFTDRS